MPTPTSKLPPRSSRRWPRIIAMGAMLLPLQALAVTALDASFTPNTVVPGATSTLTFKLLNSGSGDVTAAGASFTLPSGVIVAAPVTITDGCGFTGSASTAGTNTFTIGTGGTVPAGGNCTWSIVVQAPGVQGTAYDFTIPANAFTTSDLSNPPSANSTTTLRTANFVPVAIVVTPPPHAIADSGTNGTTLSDTPANRTMVYTLTNSNLVDLTGVAMNFPKSTGVFSGTGELQSTTCGGTVTFDATTKELVLSAATIPAGGSCTISESMRAGGIPGFGAIPQSETVASGYLTSNEGATNAAYTRNVNLQAGAFVSKTFDTTTTHINGTVIMTLPVKSYAAYPLVFDIPDPIPAGLTVTNVSVAVGTNPVDTAGWNGTSTSCSVPTTPATGTVHFTGTLAATYVNAPTGDLTTFASCTYTITLTADSSGFGATPPSSLVKTLTNTLGAIAQTDPTGGGDSVAIIVAPNSAAVSVLNCDPAVSTCVPSPLTVVQTYTDALGNVTNDGGTGALSWGGDGYFTFTVSMTNGDALSGLTLNDTFSNNSAGGNYVVVSAPTTYLAGNTNTCGGMLTATPGSPGFSLSGGSVAAGGTCQIIVPVHMTHGSGFSTNPAINNTLHLVDVYGTDAGTGSAIVLGQQSNIALNKGGWVSLKTVLTATNNQIIPNGKTTLVFTVTKNQGVAPISNADFQYDLTALNSATGVFQATALNAALTTCGGSIAVLDNATSTAVSTATPAQFLHVTGLTMSDGTAGALAGYSAASQQTDTTAYQAQSCKIAIDIEETDGAVGGFTFKGNNDVSGQYLNNIPAVGTPSNHSPTSSSQSISVVTPSAMGITKTFSPAPATAGTPVTLAITLDNSTGVVVDLSGISFTDTYPSGLINTATPGVTMAAAAGKTCSGVGVGTLAAAAGGSTVSWTGGSMHANDVCVISVQVIPLSSGLTNTITPASLSNDQNVVTTQFSQLLGTTQSIGVTKQFAPDTIWVGQNSILKLNLVNFFPNPTDAGTLTLTDTLPTGLTIAGAATDVNGCGIAIAATTGSTAITLTGGSIPAGGACEIDVPVTSTTPSATPYINTIDAGAMIAKVSNVTTANSGAATAPLTVYAPITINKTVTSSDSKVTGVSNTFTFTTSGCSIAANNGLSGTVTLTNTLTGSGTVSGVTPDTCTITETAPASPPANYAWTTPATQSVTATATGTNTLTFTNVLTRQLTTISLSKTVTVTPTSPVPTISGSINFTADCSASTDGSFTGTVALSGATGTGTISNVPKGANCTVSEDAASLPTVANYTWGTTPAPVVLSNVNASPAAFTNLLNANPGSLSVTKTISNVASNPSATALAFPFTVACSTPTASYNGSVTVAAGALTGTSSAISIPAGSTSCKITEGLQPTAPTNYTWGAATYTQPAATAVAPGSSLSGAIVNPLNANPAGLTVTKTLTGPATSPSTVDLAFPFTVACATPTATYNGSVTVAAGSLSGNSAAISIPAGSTNCQIAEGSKPTAPSNYTWGTATYTQPAATALAAGGSLSGAINNPLTRISSTITLSKTISGGPTAGVSGTFNFNLDCAASNDGTFTGSVTLTNATNATGSVTAPQGANCSVSEDASALPTVANYAWGATPPAVTLTTSTGTNTAAFTNTLTAQTGSLTVTKSVTGGPAGYSGSFPITVACTDSTNKTVSGITPSATQNVTAATGGDGSVTFANIPQGSTCTVSEGAMPSAPLSYVWGTPAITQPTGTIGATALTATVVNNLTQIISGLTVNVQITGGPTTFGASFPISVDCTLSGAPVSGVTPASPTAVAAGPGTTAGVQVYASIPQGAQCLVSEGTLPAPPNGYTWGTPIITQAGAAIQAVKGSASAAGMGRGSVSAQDASSNQATVVNPLILTTPQQTPVAVPLNARWMLLLLGVILLAGAIARMRRAQR